MPTKGNKVHLGNLNLRLVNGVQVNALLTGLTPNQKHGVHIHQFGDLTDMVAGKSAGGHYESRRKYAWIAPIQNRHAGSYGNIDGKSIWEVKFDFRYNHHDCRG